MAAARVAVKPVEARRKPWLTWTTAAICVVIFAGVGLRNDNEVTWAFLQKWGAPSSHAIWTGAYWGLLTSVFVHLAAWHLAFNVYWLWILGGTLERAIGSRRWLALFLGAALVSSSAQLATSVTTGVGLSGVLYGMFGFMWVGRQAYPQFARVLTKQLILLFLIWLLGCVVLTKLGVWQVGNAAHIGGLLFGVATGYAGVRKPDHTLPKAAVASLLMAAMICLFWCPWSFEWTTTKGYAAHQKGDYRTAVNWYLKSQRFHKQEDWVLQNLALAYWSLGDKASYAATLERLRRVSPNAAQTVENAIEEEPRR